MEDIFKTLDPRVLGEIARYLKWDPVTGDDPLTLLSELKNQERFIWLDSHRHLVADEISSVGSHTFGKRRSYGEIVQNLAEKLGLSFSTADSTVAIEQMMFSAGFFGQ